MTSAKEDQYTMISIEMNGVFQVLIIALLIAIRSQYESWFSQSSTRDSQNYRRQGIPIATGPIHDMVLGSLWSQNIYQFCRQNQLVYNILLDTSTIINDVFIYWFIVEILFVGWSIFHICTLSCIALRLICLHLNWIPPPSDMHWVRTNVPSPFVSFDVVDDMFFSGHVCHATICALYVFQMWPETVLSILFGIFIVVYQAFIVVVVTRGHYCMDVYSGFTTALMVYLSLKHLA